MMKLFTFTIFLTFISIRAYPYDAPPLRVIMQQLKASSNVLQQAILHEDYNAILDSAEHIANYPINQQQKKVITNVLSSRDLESFNKYDQKVRRAAEGIIDEVHGAREMNSILKNQQIIIYACVKCHSQFRKRLRSVLNPFYGHRMPPSPPF